MRRLLALFLICLLAAGCGTQRSSTPVCHLVLESGEGFRVEDPACTVRQGADAVFALVADPGYRFAQADYPDYSLSAAGGRLTLTLHRVQYSGAVSVTFTPNPVQLRYHGNGGSGPDGQATVSLPADTAQLRPNTSQGAELFQRAGHTLYAWNTLPDGSGSAVGLGSRTDCGQAGVDLYAQWQPWTDSGEFLYERQADGAAITGYQGNASLLCIPARLDGLPVTCIRAGAFAGLQSETVILSPGLEEIEAGAYGKHHWSKSSFYDEMSNNLAKYYVAKTSSGELVGYAGTWHIIDEGHITTIAVKKDYLRNHIGEAIIHKIIEDCYNDGVKYLTLEVRVSNEPAIKLYQKYGFQSLGTRKGYYQDNNEDALIMWTENIFYDKFKSKYQENIDKLNSLIKIK